MATTGKFAAAPVARARGAWRLIVWLRVYSIPGAGVVGSALSARAMAGSTGAGGASARASLSHPIKGEKTALCSFKRTPCIKKRPAPSRECGGHNRKETANTQLTRTTHPQHIIPHPTAGKLTGSKMAATRRVGKALRTACADKQEALRAAHTYGSSERLGASAEK
ncbi:hypothetical protein HYPSUDRAFT_216323 [Hypholoma sublateritium FD-334 SS-4]|uniref:Uncharacterized protein n=1 Tax=Hypholoma sublateritium (strain FD-334 SS-4) TaxID=945553 RepID=A0A0D2MCY7_HYPSF|nr:hypothetical protein HYPSUDRAFT_216323 [Hypholoma sublateritium FD-334 SS-4]